jgi:hypothetical protein
MLVDAHFFDIDGCLSSEQFLASYQILLKKTMASREPLLLKTLFERLKPTEHSLLGSPSTALLLNLQKMELEFQNHFYEDFRQAVRCLLLKKHPALFDFLKSRTQEASQLLVGSVSNRLDVIIDSERADDYRQKTPSVAEFITDTHFILREIGITEKTFPEDKISLIPLLSELLHTEAKVGDTFSEIQGINRQAFNIMTSTSYTEEDAIKNAEARKEAASKACGQLEIDADKNKQAAENISKKLEQAPQPYYQQELEKYKHFFEKLPQQQEKLKAEEQRCIKDLAQIRADKEPIILAQRQKATELLRLEKTEQGVSVLRLLEKLRRYKHDDTTKTLLETAREIAEGDTSTSSEASATSYQYSTSLFAHHQEASQYVSMSCQRSICDLYPVRYHRPSYETYLSQRFPISDHSKVAIYFQAIQFSMASLRSHFPDVTPLEMRVHIYDDQDSLLENAIGIFKKHPQLLPAGVTVQFIGYAGNALSFKDTSIAGQGPLLSEADLRRCMITYRDLSKPRTPSMSRPEDGSRFLRAIKKVSPNLLDPIEAQFIATASPVIHRKKIPLPLTLQAQPLTLPAQMDPEAPTEKQPSTGALERSSILQRRASKSSLVPKLNFG